MVSVSKITKSRRLNLFYNNLMKALILITHGDVRDNKLNFDI